MDMKKQVVRYSSDTILNGHKVIIIKIQNGSDTSDYKTSNNVAFPSNFQVL